MTIEHMWAKLVILTLEDIIELTELCRIIPICSFCRKVRDDGDYWQELNTTKYSIRFSQVCPD